jgi:chromosome segregation protein
VLRGLELAGFKTFASRTRFEFPGDLTALVGPNGSGKSNVADAVRWVLAEPAGRGLRVRKAEDLIFAGGGGRPPAGYAEATVVLDNTSRAIPLDADEVAVTRRLHRSGESEYWLNGVRVRQREVVEALARLGVVQSSYAVIGQGLIDAALSLRPEERRELIEEAADVRRHQSALEEARGRLAATRANLQRLDDLLRELKPRVEKLAQHAAEAEEHRRLAGELARLLALWYAARWHGATARVAATATAAEHARREHDAARARLHEVAQRLAATRSESNALRHRHESVLHELRNAESAADRARHEVAYTLREIQRRTEELDRLKDEAEDAERRAAREEAALAEARTEQRRLRSAIEACEQEAVDASGEELAEQALEAARRAVLDRRAERARLESERHAAQTLAERIGAELANLETERDTSAPDPTLGERTEQASQRATELSERLQRAEAERQVLRHWLGEAEERLATDRAEGAALAERLREAERRLAQLAREEAAGDGYSPAVRAVLERAGRRFAAGSGGRTPVAEARLTGIVGAVADLIAVPPGYELAFEAALGGRSHDLVVERWAEAEAAIRYLRDAGIGRATFLPLDTIQPGRRATWPPEAGVHGVAADLCRAEPRFQAIVDRLLGNVIVVDDLAVARRCLARNGRGHQFVTLQGDTVGSWGAITGGSRPSRRDGLWRRRAEVATLTAEREMLAKRVDETRRRVERLSAELAARRAQVQTLSADIETLERAWAEANRQLAQLQAEAERDRFALEEAARRQERSAARRAALLEEQAALEERRGAIESALAEAAAHLAIAERDLAAAETAAAAARQRARTEAAQRANLHAAARNADEAVRRVQATLEREREIATSARRRRDALAQQIDAARHDANRHQALADAAAARAEALRARAHELAERRKMLDAELERLAEREQDERDAVASAAERLAEARREREAAADALDALRSRMANDGLDPDQLSPPAADLDVDELDRRITRLRARLRSSPAGGYAVIAEYEEERARLTEGIAQSEDLRTAEANLTRTIASLETLIAARFDQTVAAVNVEFRRYFQRLFGGGTARLGIGEGCGIDIEAHPPGKRPQSLALLSGGERALTAAALVFALVRVNPIPFCVLDEVDAALDESNVRRFVDALQELTATTQFVVITHNRVTMEAAAAIYGLAVGSDGATKIVSLQLREASSPARQAAG